MIALTGIVFAIGTVIVQFSTATYSPRAGALARPRSYAVSRTWDIFGDVHLRVFGACMGRYKSGKIPLFSNMLVVLCLWIPHEVALVIVPSPRRDDYLALALKGLPESGLRVVIDLIFVGVARHPRWSTPARAICTRGNTSSHN
jgi:hypothetical protein